MGQNPYCDDNRCQSATGETRIFPTGGGDMILCHSCYEHEIAHRKEMNQMTLDRDSRFPLPRWRNLKLHQAAQQPVIDNVLTDGFPRLEIRDSRTNICIVLLERGDNAKNFRIHLMPGLEAHIFQGDPPRPVKVVKSE